MQRDVERVLTGSLSIGNGAFREASCDQLTGFEWRLPMPDYAIRAHHGIPRGHCGHIISLWTCHGERQLPRTKRVVKDPRLIFGRQTSLMRLYGYGHEGQVLAQRQKGDVTLASKRPFRAPAINMSGRLNTIQYLDTTRRQKQCPEQRHIPLLAHR